MTQLHPYTVKEFAEFTRTSEKTVRKACREGRIKAIKIGKDWIISLSNVKELL